MGGWEGGRGVTCDVMEVTNHFKVLICVDKKEVGHRGFKG